jgi:hypothetical protein
MTPELLFRYCFSAVTGVGFGLTVIGLAWVLVVALIAGASAFKEYNEETKD